MSKLVYDRTWPCGRQVCVADDHYVGPARNCPTPSFRVVVDYYKGYMVLVRPRDEEHPKPILLVKTLSLPILFPTSQNFHHIEVKYCRPNTKDQNVLRTYLRWDTRKCFK